VHPLCTSNQRLHVSGVALSNMGRVLLRVVEREPRERIGSIVIARPTASTGNQTAIAEIGHRGSELVGTEVLKARQHREVIHQNLPASG